MSLSSQSILQGSSQPYHLDLGNFRVASVQFPGNLKMPSHFHPRACLAIVLQGQVVKAFGQRSFQIAPHFACTMPPEERHSDVFAQSGARILVIEPAHSASATQLFAPCKQLLQEIRHVGDPYLFLLANRLESEIQRPDEVSHLVINGLALEIMALAARGAEGRNDAQPMPQWLAEARDYLHDRFAASFRLEELADAVGVHPVYLARTFRRYFHLSPGEYLRRLRIEWVKEHLLQSNLPLAQLAQEAGFADQSHLTRLFKAHYGVTPGRLRRHNGQKE